MTEEGFVWGILCLGRDVLSPMLSSCFGFISISSRLGCRLLLGHESISDAAETLEFLSDPQLGTYSEIHEVDKRFECVSSM